MLNSIRTRWIRNYWDDWNGSGRYPIDGGFLFSDDLPPYQYVFYEWKNYDYLPRKHPYG